MDRTTVVKSVFSPIMFIILCALFVRLAVIIFFQPPLLQDEKDYYAIAQSIYHGNGFSLEGEPTAYRAPFYPVFLAFLFSIFGDTILPIKIIQTFADTLSCVILFMICVRFFSKSTGYLAVTVYTFFPGNALYVSLLMTEVLFTTLFLTAILLSTWRNFEHSAISKIGLGIVFAVLTLLRQNAMIIIVIFFIWQSIRTQSIYGTLKRHMLVIISFLIFLTPWLIRNKILFDQYAITSNGGVNFWIGHNPTSNGAFKYTLQNNPLEKVMGEFNRSKVGYEEGLNFLLHNPATEVKLLMLKFAHFVEPDFSLMQSMEYKPEWKYYQRSVLVYREFNPLLLYGLHFLSVIVILAGVWGLIFANETKEQYLLYIRLIVLFWVFSHLIFFGVARFRLPIMPLIIAMAVYSFELWRFKTYSMTKPKIVLFSIISLLLFTSWISAFIVLYFQ